jgi:hypothetical protein
MKRRIQVQPNALYWIEFFTVMSETIVVTEGPSQSAPKALRGP